MMSLSMKTDDNLTIGNSANTTMNATFNDITENKPYNNFSRNYYINFLLAIRKKLSKANFYLEQLKSLKTIKKRVNFLPNVTVVLVESYKKYNLDEESNIEIDNTNYDNNKFCSCRGCIIL